MRRLGMILLAVSLPTAGCSVSFKFGKAPKAPTGVFRVDDCVHKHAIHLKPAWSSAQRERNPDPRITRNLKGRAWTFYRGPKRMDAADALELLRDKQLHGTYRAIWKPMASRGRARVLGGGIGLAAAALLAITGGVLLHDYPGPGKSMSLGEKTRAITGFTLLGVAAVTAAVMPVLMRVGYRDVRAAETFRTLFLSNKLEPALRKAVARYKARVRKACLKRIEGR